MTALLLFDFLDAVLIRWGD